MSIQIVIQDQELARRLLELADQQARSVEEVIAGLLADQPLAATHQDQESPEALARRVRLSLYDRARRIWRERGELDKAALTDAQMDEQFWAFDPEDVPRLQSEKDDVVLSDGSLLTAGRLLQEAGFHSGHSDIAERSRDILRDEFAEYLIQRQHRPAPDAPADPD
jgi:hypothetical protein